MRFENASSQQQTSKIVFFPFFETFSRKKTHSAEKGALRSPNAFLQAENIYESERGTI